LKGRGALLASEGEAPSERANLSSLGSNSFRLTRATASPSAWSSSRSGGCPKRTVANLGAKDAPAKERGLPTARREVSLWRTRAPPSQRAASSWLRGAPSDLARSRASSCGAFLTHARGREGDGSTSLRRLRACFRPARAFLDLGCASLKLEGAREGKAPHLLRTSALSVGSFASLRMTANLELISTVH